jgi:hypothetical protein
LNSRTRGHIVGDGGRQVAAFPQPEDALLELALALGVAALQRVAAGAGMGVDERYGFSFRFMWRSTAVSTVCLSTSAWLPA